MKEMMIMSSSPLPVRLIDHLNSIYSVVFIAAVEHRNRIILDTRFLEHKIGPGSGYEWIPAFAGMTSLWCFAASVIPNPVRNPVFHGFLTAQE